MNNPIEQYIKNKKNVHIVKKIGNAKNALRTKRKQRVLFAYCFNIWEPCRYHDFLLAKSLELRGAEVIPLICGGAQEIECSNYSGKWGNDSVDIGEKEKLHNQNCKNCINADRIAWKEWSNFSEVLVAKDWVEKEDWKFVKKYIDDLDLKEYKEWKYNNYPIGKWAWLAWCNGYVTSRIEGLEETFQKTYRNFAYNVMIMLIVSKRIIDEIKPDVIYGNDSFYYPWSIIETIAKEKGIPFYNGYGYRLNTYSYAQNVATMFMDLSDAWESFSYVELSKEQKDFMQKYLEQREANSDSLFNTSNPEKVVGGLSDEAIHGKIDWNKKTALLPSNVSWDGAALERDIQFDSMWDWIRETVKFFEERNEWQLIIRTHPAEIVKGIPEAGERFGEMLLELYNGELPCNIIWVDGNAKLTFYDLLSITSIGIAYTTTAGLEMACRGIPVITAGNSPYRGKGFTFDTNTTAEYFDEMEYLMCNSISDDEKERIKSQARKFFYLYYFRYMMENPFFNYTLESGINLKTKKIEDLLEGKNRIIDYVCDSILEHKPIVSKDRIPPATTI